MKNGYDRVSLVPHDFTLRLYDMKKRIFTIVTVRFSRGQFQKLKKLQDGERIYMMLGVKKIGTRKVL